MEYAPVSYRVNNHVSVKMKMVLMQGKWQNQRYRNMIEDCVLIVKIGKSYSTYRVNSEFRGIAAVM